jgi:hypothetical protein
MKHLIIASLVILSVNVSHGQTKLGLKLNPAIITQRLTFPDDSSSIKKGPNSFNLSVMLFADIGIAQNYFFNTGIGYTSKRMNLEYFQQDGVSTESKGYNVQYVQIPATLKLYTNEIALDKKLCFQFGPLIEVAVHNKETNQDVTIIDKFQPVDISLLFATGLEIQLAPQTAIQLGFNYTRGLINVAKSAAEGAEGMVIKNDLYSIEIAVKF